jgi:hypothetical protein
VQTVCQIQTGGDSPDTVGHFPDTVSEILALRAVRPCPRLSTPLVVLHPKSLNRAVKRNGDRFPRDFMFQISADEWQNLKYQIGTLKTGRVKPAIKCWMELK